MRIEHPRVALAFKAALLIALLVVVMSSLEVQAFPLRPLRAAQSFELDQFVSARTDAKR